MPKPSTRGPSEANLAEMSPTERWRKLNEYIADIRNERDMILRGEITPSDGASRASLLESCKRRLHRADELSEALDIDLTPEPDDPSVRFI